MTNFDGSEHPRGHISNPGSFSEKQNSAAEVQLTESPLTSIAVLNSASKMYREAERLIVFASAKHAAETTLAMHPKAAFLTLDEREDEGSGFFAIEITDADGRVLVEDRDELSDELDGLTLNLPSDGRPMTSSRTEGQWVWGPDPDYAWLVFDDTGRNARLDIAAANNIDLSIVNE